MYRISVCDDDKTELEKICGMIAEYTAEKGIPAQVRPFDTPSSLLEFESANECADIYILDIIMPGMNGVQLGKEVRRRNAEAFIIFLTTSKDYALESYSVKAFAYIIKPAKKEDITAELSDCFSRIRKPSERFVLKCVSGITAVKAEDIVFIEYYNHQMIYRLAGGETMESVYFREPFDSLISEYAKNGSFVKTSASFLANLEHVRSVNAAGFVMSDGTELTITRKYSDARKKYIDYELNGGAAL